MVFLAPTVLLLLQQHMYFEQCAAGSKYRPRCKHFFGTVSLAVSRALLADMRTTGASISEVARRQRLRPDEQYALEIMDEEHRLEDCVRMWRPEWWQQQVAENDVLFMTPQAFAHALRSPPPLRPARRCSSTLSRTGWWHWTLWIS